MADRRGGFFPNSYDEFSSTLLRNTIPDARAEQDSVARDLVNADLQQREISAMDTLLKTKRQSMLGDIQQKSLQQEAEMLPAISALDPTADDYDQQLTSIIKANPYAIQNPAIQSIMGIHEGARKTYETQLQRTADKDRALAERKDAKIDAMRMGIAQSGADNLGRYDAELAKNPEGDPLAAAAQVSSVGQSQGTWEKLAKAGIPGETIETLKDPATGLLDPVKAAGALATWRESHVDDDQGRYAANYIGKIDARRAKSEDISKEEEDRYAQLAPIANNWITETTRPKAASSSAPPDSQAPVAKKIVIRGGQVVR